jgi:hypothetical protein
MDVQPEPRKVLVFGQQRVALRTRVVNLKLEWKIDSVLQPLSHPPFSQ